MGRSYGGRTPPRTSGCQAAARPGESPESANVPDTAIPTCVDGRPAGPRATPTPEAIVGRSLLNANEQVHQSSVEDYERRLHRVLPAVARVDQRPCHFLKRGQLTGVDLFTQYWWTRTVTNRTIFAYWVLADRARRGQRRPPAARRAHPPAASARNATEVRCPKSG